MERVLYKNIAGKLIYMPVHLLLIKDMKETLKIPFPFYIDLNKVPQLPGMYIEPIILYTYLKECKRHTIPRELSNFNMELIKRLYVCSYSDTYIWEKILHIVHDINNAK